MLFNADHIPSVRLKSFKRVFIVNMHYRYTLTCFRLGVGLSIIDTVGVSLNTRWSNCSVSAGVRVFPVLECWVELLLFLEWSVFPVPRTGSFVCSITATTCTPTKVSSVQNRSSTSRIFCLQHSVRFEQKNGFCTKTFFFVWKMQWSYIQYTHISKTNLKRKIINFNA